MDSIRHYLERTMQIDDRDWALFSSKLIKRQFKKKALLLETGTIESYLSIIESGVVRFCIPKIEEDNDITFGFSFENEFVSAYNSFLTQTPSIYQIQALTKTNVWSISYRDLQEVYNITKVGDRIGRLSAERLLLIKSKRELSLLNDTATQRYLKLFVDRPNVIKDIPLKYIASYIGVTPQALSRIRKQIS